MLKKLIPLVLLVFITACSQGMSSGNCCCMQDGKPCPMMQEGKECCCKGKDGVQCPMKGGKMDSARKKGEKKSCCCCKKGEGYAPIEKPAPLK